MAEPPGDCSEAVGDQGLGPAVSELHRDVGEFLGSLVDGSGGSFGAESSLGGLFKRFFALKERLEHEQLTVAVLALAKSGACARTPCSRRGLVSGAPPWNRPCRLAEIMCLPRPPACPHLRPPSTAQGRAPCSMLWLAPTCSPGERAQLRLMRCGGAPRGGDFWRAA